VTLVIRAGPLLVPNATVANVPTPFRGTGMHSEPPPETLLPNGPSALMPELHPAVSRRTSPAASPPILMGPTSISVWPSFKF
jgi:hypothetical protein